jgi:hypothetical protein
MSLYVIVHHRDDGNKPWENAWLSVALIAAIQTTKEIGQLCLNAQSRQERVYVHRCGWGEFPPVVCCSAEVEDVAAIDKSTMLVRFANPVVLSETPPRTPVKGQNFYIT